ncbi:hypothetical protein HK104_005499, partial [Borealophlyctis nickersoniae]
MSTGALSPPTHDTRLSNVAIIAVTFNIIAVLAAAYQCFRQTRALLGRTWGRYDPANPTRPKATPFRKIMVVMMWLLTLSGILGVIQKPMYTVCQIQLRCDPEVWGYRKEGRSVGATVGLVMYIIGDSFLYTGALLYVFATFERFKIFQAALQYPKRLIPTLQIVFCILFVIGLTGDYMHIVVATDKRVYAAIFAALFWLALTIVDITVSALMVRTVTRVTRELERAGGGSTNMGVGSSYPSSQQMKSSVTYSLSEGSEVRSSSGPRYDGVSDATN